MEGIIYCVENIINGKFYIGQTVGSISERSGDHIRDAKQGSVTHFHKALRKYNKADWNWTIICDVEAPTNILLKEYLDIAEIMYIQQYDSFEHGYNLTLGGGGTLGRKHSQETRQLLRDISLNMSDETKHKIGIANTGKAVSLETRQLLREIQLGKKASVETLKIMSIAQTGRKHSVESRKKLSKISKGRKFSKETRQKLRDASTGVKMSEETKKKISDTEKGIKQPIVKCPHCNKLGGSHNMKRYHFDNCKYKQ